MFLVLIQTYDARCNKVWIGGEAASLKITDIYAFLCSRILQVLCL